MREQALIAIIENTCTRITCELCHMDREDLTRAEKNIEDYVEQALDALKQLK